MGKGAFPKKDIPFRVSLYRVFLIQNFPYTNFPGKECFQYKSLLIHSFLNFAKKKAGIYIDMVGDWNNG